MAYYYDLTGLLAIAFGLYSLAGGVVLVRHPNWGLAVMAECERSAGLQYLLAILMFCMGLTIIFVHPMGQDGLSILITVLGWLIAAEGLFMFAFPGVLMRWAQTFMSNGVRIYGYASLLIGGLLIAFGVMRIC